LPFIAPKTEPIQPKVEIPIIETISQPERFYEQPEPVKPEPDQYYDIKNSCVKYVRSKVPEAPLIDAIDYPVNTINPKVGDIIKLQYYNATTSRYTYHVGFIEEVTEEGYKISQGNKPKGATSTEEIKKTDDNVVGFFDVSLFKEILKLPQDMQDTLKCESNFSHYKQGAVIRGKDDEIGIAQWKRESWQTIENIRRARKEKRILLDIWNPYDQIENMKYAFDYGFNYWWSCYKRDIVSSTD
jgi:hypothetical protein